MRSRTGEPRRPVARTLDALLVVVAAAGLVVVLCRLAGAVLGLELVTFATGSMSPAFPQHSVAIAQRAPLDSVRVGDVVVVDRAGRPPITHRVVAVAVDGGTATLRLRGDANRDPDPTRYRVHGLSRVVAPLPAVLAPVRLVGTPQAGIAAAVLAALAVGWALWPRGRRSAPPEALGT